MYNSLMHNGMLSTKISFRSYWMVESFHTLSQITVKHLFILVLLYLGSCVNFAAHKYPDQEYLATNCS